MELKPQDDNIRAVLQTFITQLSRAFAHGLKSGIEAGDVRPDIDVCETAEMLTSTMFGLGVMARSGFPEETFERIVESLLVSLAA